MYDWSSWFAAVGTVGTFVVGGEVLWREIRRDRAREVQQRREQAEQVAAWVVKGNGDQLEFVADNRSDLPVYDAVIISDSLSPSKPANIDMGMIQGGSQSKLTYQDMGYLGGVQAAHPVAFCFTDHTGRRWLRDGLGLLYPGTQDVLNALEFPNGIVGGSKAARAYYESQESGSGFQTSFHWDS